MDWDLQEGETIKVTLDYGGLNEEAITVAIDLFRDYDFVCGITVIKDGENEYIEYDWYDAAGRRYLFNDNPKSRVAQLAKNELNAKKELIQKLLKTAEEVLECF